MASKKKAMAVTRAEVEDMVRKMGEAVIATCANQIARDKAPSFTAPDPPVPTATSAINAAFEGLSLTVDSLIKEAAQLAAKIQPVLKRSQEEKEARTAAYATAFLEEGDCPTLERISALQIVIASLANELADLKARVQL